jgi:hypothetical protein
LTLENAVKASVGALFREGAGWGPSSSTTSARTGAR